MSNSRRDFFKRLVPKPRLRSQSQDQSATTVFKLGCISVFPVGSETKINLGEKSLILKSLPEGLQLFDQYSNQNHGLAIGPDGQLIGDLSQTWPSDSVLSIFSGEISNL